MEKEYIIGQIIKWEERDKYFWNHKYPKSGEYDLFNMSINYDSKPSIFNTPIGMFFSKKKDRDFREIENHDIKMIAMWVKRPHHYKVGDKVKINFVLGELNE